MFKVSHEVSSDLFITVELTKEIHVQKQRLCDFVVMVKTSSSTFQKHK